MNVVAQKSHLKKGRMAVSSLLCALALCCGCTHAPQGATADQSTTPVQIEGSTTVSDSDHSKHNAQLIQEAIGIDDDCALGAANTLAKLGIGELKTAKSLDDTSYTAEVVDSNGKTYILEFSQMGYLQIVQSDDLDGTILYGAIK